MLNASINLFIKKYVLNVRVVDSLLASLIEAFSLRRHYPEQVIGYYLSLLKESTPEILAVVIRTFQSQI